MLFLLCYCSRSYKSLSSGSRTTHTHTHTQPLCFISTLYTTHNSIVSHDTMIQIGLCPNGDNGLLEFSCKQDCCFVCMKICFKYKVLVNVSVSQVYPPSQWRPAKMSPQRHCPHDNSIFLHSKDHDGDQHHAFQVDVVPLCLPLSQKTLCFTLAVYQRIKSCSLCVTLL